MKTTFRPQFPLKLALVLATALAACSHSPGTPGGSHDSHPFTEASPPSDGFASPTADTVALPPSHLPSHLLIRKCDLTFSADSLNVLDKPIFEVADEHGAWAQEERRGFEGGVEYLDVHWRVPAQEFESMVRELRGVNAKLEAMVATTEDASNEWMAQEAYHKIRQAETRELSALRDGGGKLDDRREIQEDLSATRQEDVAAQKSARDLASEIQWASIHARFEAPVKVIPIAAPTFGERLLLAFWEGAAGLAEIALGLVSIWPIWVLGISLYLLWAPFSRIIRKWRHSSAHI